MADIIRSEGIIFQGQEMPMDEGILGITVPTDAVGWTAAVMQDLLIRNANGAWAVHLEGMWYNSIVEAVLLKFENNFNGLWDVCYNGQCFSDYDADEDSGDDDIGGVRYLPKFYITGEEALGAFMKIYMEEHGMTPSPSDVNEEKVVKDIMAITRSMFRGE